MNVLFYANILDYTSGNKSFEAEETQNIGSLIDQLGKKFGDKFREFLLGDKTCFFLVNGKGIMTTGGLKTPLQQGDKIEILPHVGGG